MYSCEIQTYVKEGEEDQLDCYLTVEGGKYWNLILELLSSMMSLPTP